MNTIEIIPLAKVAPWILASSLQHLEPAVVVLLPRAQLVLEPSGVAEVAA